MDMQYRIQNGSGNICQNCEEIEPPKLRSGGGSFKVGVLAKADSYRFGYVHGVIDSIWRALVCERSLQKLEQGIGQVTRAQLPGPSRQDFD